MNEAPNISHTQLAEFQNLMEELYGCCKDRMQMQVARFGLPEAEMRCLMLFRSERYLTPREVADKLGVAKSRVTKIVSGLETRGLIKRVSDPEDGRVTLLCLDGEGESLVGNIDAYRQDMHREILSLLSGERREALLDSLGALKRVMGTVRERHCG